MEQLREQHFLEDIAKQYGFTGTRKEVFLLRLDRQNEKLGNKDLIDRIENVKQSDNPRQNFQDYLKSICQAFSDCENCPVVLQKKRGRQAKGEEPWRKVFGWLWDEKYPQWQLEPKINTDKNQINSQQYSLNRCILGLKGNYQDAQEKLTEIAEHLRNLLNDKTLSITKVEAGSIILIVESYQTGYEQLKRLIGQEIAGFPVEYAIDEWQDVCRRMLLDRKLLTSNTVLGQVSGNRDLIDEDLFVDLALVKPKRSQNEKHAQDIHPEKGSDFFVRQEVEKRFAYREFLQEIIGKRTEKKIAIIGEPGAGKTTLLQKLAFWLLQSTDDLVIWVDLAELGDRDLGEYLEEKWLKEALGKSREEIKGEWEDKFKGGAVWLLLDGFDEMSQGDQDALKFRGWVMDAQIIVTCRLNLWQANPTQLQVFQTYLTQPFQDKQMQEFIGRLFQGLVEAGGDVQLAESLWSELQTTGKERIKDLCRNPLRLTLLCSTWQVGKALPETRAELYESFVEWMYAWKENRFEVTEEEMERLNVALGALAKASLEAETSRFRLSYRLVCQYLGKPKAQESLLPMALPLGWLNEVGVAAENPREKVYGFYHATFQEYFAALAVDDWDYFVPRSHVDKPVDLPLSCQGERQEKQEASFVKGGWGDRYRIFQPQWKQVILLWLGRGDVVDEEKEGFIRGLVEFKDGCGEWSLEEVDRGLYEYHAYFLAVAGVNEFKTCSLATEIVRQVVTWGYGEFDIEKQEWRTFLELIEEGARVIIPETILQQAISELITILEHYPNKYTCLEVADSLDKIETGNFEAIADLVRLLETTQDRFTRWSVAYILGKIGQGNPEAIAALVRLLETTQDKDTCWEVADSLGKIGKENPKAIAALVRLLQTTQDEVPRWKVANSLSQIGKENPEAIAALVQILKTTQDKSTRMSVANSLGEIGQGNSEAIAALVQILKTTQDEDIRMSVADSLGKIGKENPEAIVALVQILKTTQDEDIRMSVANILGKIEPGNSKAIAALLQILKTTQDEDIRMSVVESLSEIEPGNSEAIAALVQILKTTQDEDIRMSVVESLSEIEPGNSEAIAALVQILKTTQDEFTRRRVANSLSKTRQANPEAIAALVQILKTTQDGFTRWSMAKSLGKIGQANPEAIAALLQILKTTQDESIRQNVPCGLEEIDPGNPEAIAALVEILKTTQDEFTRRRVADSLGKIGQGNSEAIAALLRILQTTQDKSTHSRAVEQLGKIGQGNSEAIAALVRILQTQDKSISWNAADSLEKIITTPEQYAGVVSALKDNLSDEVYQNNFELFDKCYKVVWNCAANLPYPQFYQAWHHPPTTPHPEVTDQTPVPHNLPNPPLDSLQHLPIYCLNAHILADETDPREIAQTLCQLICEEAFPDEDYPEGVTEPSELRKQLKKLKRRQNLPKLAILITHCHPRDELIAFCHKLTNIVAIAWLTDEPLEAPLKGFPANQPNLISAIESWLKEIRV